MTLDELKTEIAAKFDELELLDFLDLDINDLVELLEEQIAERKEELEQSCAGN